MADNLSRGGILEQLDPGGRGRQEQADIAERKRRERIAGALLTSGDPEKGGNVLLSTSDLEPPTWPEVGQGALDALDWAGQTATALQGVPMVGPILGGVGRLAQAPRAMMQGARAAAPAAVAQAQKADRAVNWSNIQRKFAAERGSRMPTVTKPKPDPDIEEILKFIDDNPFSQAVPGRAGIPTKLEQSGMAERFFKSGQVPEGFDGPWGRDMPGTVREILRQQHVRDRIADALSGPVKKGRKR